MLAIFAILLILALLTMTSEWFGQSETVESISKAISATVGWFGNNIFMLCGIAFIAFGFYLYILFIPHKAEKYFESYKKGLISRKEAIEKMGQTFYRHARHGLPSAWESKIITTRLKMLRRRVREETGFMEDLLRFMRLKAKEADKR